MKNSIGESSRRLSFAALFSQTSNSWGKLFGGVRPTSTMGIMITVLVGSVLIAAPRAAAQTAREVRGAAPVVPLADEPPAKIIADAPLAEPLSHGRVVIQYRTENLHIVPVFGPAALAVSPRIGHIHVTVDDNPWRWADASGEPLIVNGLPPGPHKILIQLENANHQPLDQAVVQFTIPPVSAQTEHH